MCKAIKSPVIEKATATTKLRALTHSRLFFNSHNLLNKK